MKPVFRKILASLAVTLGVILVYFELFGTRAASGISWFWLLVGGGMLVLGLIELLSPTEPMIRP